MFKLILLSICTLCVMSTIVASAGDGALSAKIKDIVENKLSQEDRTTLTNLMKSIRDFQGGQFSLPADKLVISHGLANFIISTKLVDMKKYQEGKEEKNKFYKELDGLRETVVRARKELNEFVRLDLDKIEAPLDDFTKSWIDFSKFLKLYLDAFTQIEEDALEIALVLA